MSAIAGFWSFDARCEPSRACGAMLGALSAYGPDASASRRIGDFAAGRNLFRLLPEDDFDRQPLADPAGGHLLVADLRIDNRDDLGSALGLDRPEIAGSADSHLLLLALLRWGESALDRIVGDFAFAWFDRGSETLILARDPLGQRPLFWRRSGGFVAFASMPAGLHAIGSAPPRPDEDTLARYLALLPPSGAASFHDGISRVESGHVVTVTRLAEHSRRYWRPRRLDLGLRTFDDHVAAFREQLDRAVACRLRGADRAVATHLSGGWDSSAVTATAARLRAPSGGRVLAFTAIPTRGRDHEEPSHRFADEGPLAAAVAARYDNIDHRLVEGLGQSLIGPLDDYVRWFDRPVFNVYNHAWLARIRTAARGEGARILLTGELGNWTISASRPGILAEYLREGRWGAWAREAWAAVRRRRMRLRGAAAASFGPWLPDAAWRLVRRLSETPPAGEHFVLHPNLLPELLAEQEEQERAAWRRDNFERASHLLMDVDFGDYRKGILGGWGIDKRDATADTRLIDFCLSLPLDMLLRRGERRPLARAALADRLPSEVLDETRKGYQAVEWAEVLERDLPAAAALVDRIGADETASRIIDVGLLRRLLREWPAGGWHESEAIGRYRIGLLDALAAGHFILALGERSTVERPGAAAPAARAAAQG
jgi:asparagine synthase (glutamine-hydrolysing)